MWPIALAAAIFLASSQSRLASPVDVSHGDKFGHALTFGLLATLILRVRFAPGRALKAALAAVAITSVYGLIDEFHQSFTPGREVDVADWLADSGGAVLAVALYALFPPWRRVLETPVPLRAARSGIALRAPGIDASASAR